MSSKGSSHVGEAISREEAKPLPAVNEEKAPEPELKDSATPPIPEKTEKLPTLTPQVSNHLKTLKQLRDLLPTYDPSNNEPANSFLTKVTYHYQTFRIEDPLFLEALETRLLK